MTFLTDHDVNDMRNIYRGQKPSKYMAINNLMRIHVRGETSRLATGQVLYAKRRSETGDPDEWYY